MGGGLLQLVAYGAQDIYLTGQPQITFFKSVYRRHTNFALESIEQNSEDIPRLNSRISYTIARNGDLLKRLWIQFSIYDSIIEQYAYWNTNNVYLNVIANDFAHAIIEQVELEIGGQVIDRQYGKWLTIWRDLTQENPYASQGALSSTGARISSQFDILYNKMAYTHTGIARSYKFLAGTTGQYGVSLIDSPRECYVPLQFWFCRNPGLAIPLIALQYHEVKLNINIAAFEAFAVLTQPIPDYNAFFNITKSFKLYADYIFLDSTERRQFTQSEHDYLIDQLQKKSTENTTNVALRFNHPVKELIITGTPGNPSALYNYNQIDTTSGAYDILYDPVAMYPTPALPPPFNWWNCIDGAATPRPIINGLGYGYYQSQLYDRSVDTETTMQLILNGKEQAVARNIKYFTRNSIWKYHTGPGCGTYGNIAVYSFALKPEEQQPSGTCNFSLINDARLLFKNIKNGENLAPLDIYAINYNILKIKAGMGGVVFSN